MSRPVEMRASYRDDAAHLLRLEMAVTKDDRQPVAWRTTTAKMLRQLSLRLLSVEVWEAEGQSETTGEGETADLVVKPSKSSKRSRRSAKASLSSSAV